MCYVEKSGIEHLHGAYGVRSGRKHGGYCRIHN